jgi:hypothetical protein
MLIIIFGILNVSFSALQLNAEKLNLKENLVFHFNFKNAKNAPIIKDLEGKFEIRSKVKDIVIQRNALRVAPVAMLYIPSEKLPDISKELTVSAWIFKHATPDVTPIMTKGTLPYDMEFRFGIGWRYPIFSYKSQAESTIWDGVFYNGDFGTRIYYGKKSFLVDKDNLVESAGYWRQVSATFKNGEVKLFVDGKITAKTKSAHPLCLRKNNNPIWVGALRLKDAKVNFITSDILLNDLRMYNRALSESEIKSLFEKDKNNYDRGRQIPAGRTHINVLDTCDEYPFDKDYDPKFKKVLSITSEFNKKLAAGNIHREAVKKAEIRSYNRRVSLLINDKEIYPVQVLPTYFRHSDGLFHWDKADLCLKDFAAADINLSGITGVNKLWAEGNKVNIEYFNELAERILKVNPAAKISMNIPIAYLTSWYYTTHKKELEKAYRGHNLVTLGHQAPLGSELWFKHSMNFVKELVSQIENGPYGKYVYAYKISGGQSAEWYWPGGAIGGSALSGYSEATIASFRAWLRQTYNNNIKKLQSAWGESNINFATAMPPSVAERKASENYLFRCPVKARKVIDFKTYMADTTFKHIKTASEIIKAINPNKLVLIYGGYLLNSNNMKLANNGRLCNRKIFKLKSLDMLATPIGYRKRRAGRVGINVNPFDASAALYNKIIWRENDLRTHFCSKIESSRTANKEETISVIERSFGHALCSGGGIWYYPFGAAWFHQEEVMKSIKKLNSVGRDSLKLKAKSNAEVAFIFSEESLFYYSYDQMMEFATGIGRSVIENASRMGASYDVYMLDDIKNKKMPDYKLYIFMNSFAIDKEISEAIKKKVRKNNAVSVWCYAPGYIQGNKFDISKAKDITGINLTSVPGKERGCLKVVSKIVAEYARKIYSPYTVGPLFKVDDDSAVKLGYFNGKVALASKKFKNHRSIYCLMPLEKELLMWLCDYAGVHVYSRDFSVFRANSNYIMIHTSKAGSRTVVLPSEAKITDVLTDKIIAEKAKEFTIKLDKGITKIYKIEK